MPRYTRRIALMYYIFYIIAFSQNVSMIRAEIQWKACSQILPNRCTQTVNQHFCGTRHNDFLIAQSKLQHATSLGLDLFSKFTLPSLPGIACSKIIILAKTTLLAATIALTGRTIASRWIAVRAGQEVRLTIFYTLFFSILA